MPLKHENRRDQIGPVWLIRFLLALVQALIWFVFFYHLKNSFEFIMIKSWARHYMPLSSIVISNYMFMINQLAAVESQNEHAFIKPGSAVLRSHPVHEQYSKALTTVTECY